MGDVGTGIAYLLSCCFCCNSSAELSPESAGNRKGKRCPQEDIVDEMFQQRTYRKDGTGRFHIDIDSTPTSSKMISPGPAKKHEDTETTPAKA